MVRRLHRTVFGFLCLLASWLFASIVFLNVLHAQTVVSASALPLGASQETLDTVSRKPIADLLTEYAFPVKKINVKRTIIAYVDVGPVESKQVLVFLHGLNGYIPIWNKTIEELSKDYRCIAVDLPGFGRSEKGELPINIFYYADLLIKFLDAMRVKEAVLVGHSMGGQIAMNMAMRHAQRFKKLVLVAPTGIEPFSAQERQAFYDNVKIATTKDKSDDILRSDFVRLFNKVPQDAEFMLKDRLFMRRASDYDSHCHAIARSMIGMVELPTWEMLEGVRQPTLLVFGKNDKLIPNQFFHVMQKPQDIGELGKSRMNKATLQMIDKCGHLPQWEHPDAVNIAIIEFLEK
jgi:pimeloyl-ACP methyl ester carboxylesterase